MVALEDKFLGMARVEPYAKRALDPVYQATKAADLRRGVQVNDFIVAVLLAS